MTLSIRGHALQRIGTLRAKRQSPASTESLDRLKAYYERYASKCTSGRLSQRYLDAFLGVCAACESSQTCMTEFEIIQGLNTIISRWPINQVQSDHATNSLTELKCIAKEAFAAIFRLSKNDLGQSKTVLVEFDRLMTSVEATRTDHTINVMSPALVGFLESASLYPGAFSFSNFIVLTRALNNLLPQVCCESPTSSDVSFEDLRQHFDLSRNYSLQLQDVASRFVLAWTEYTCANTFSSTSSRIWADLGDPSVYSPEEDVVDPIVWETAIDHARVQYELNNAIALSEISETMLGHSLRMLALATVSLGRVQEVLMAWLNSLVLNASDLDDPALGTGVLEVLSTLAIRFPAEAGTFTKLLNDIIQHAPRPDDENRPSLAALAARHLLKVLESQSTDGLVSTLYSFSNYLNGTSNTEISRVSLPEKSRTITEQMDDASIISRSSSGETLARNAIEAISIFGTNCKDAQLSALALSILIQKSERAQYAIKSKIVPELAAIALHCTERDITRVSNYYAKLEEQTDDPNLGTAIQYARNEISAHLISVDHPAYSSYLTTLLKAGIQRASNPAPRRNMTTVLYPLGTLLRESHTEIANPSLDIVQLFHNFWFRLVIAGYHVNSRLVASDINSLKQIACNSPSLALETLTDSFEADLESYPVLRQAHDHSETVLLQSALERYIPGTNVRQLNFAKSVYLNALALLEGLKCQAGVADGSLEYYRLSSLGQSDVKNLLAAIFHESIRSFIHAIDRRSPLVNLDVQLRNLLVGCCDQIGAVRQQAVSVIDDIVRGIPSAFCSFLAITTLMESITLLGWAQYEEFSDQYSPTYEFRSSRADFNIIVSDSFEDRRQNLDSAQRNARRWVGRAMLDCPSDVRTLLTSYITAAEDHVAGAPSDKGKLLAVELAMQSSARDQPSASAYVKDSADAFIGELTLRHLQASPGTHFDSPETGSLTHAEEQTIRSETLLEKSLLRKMIPFAVLREKLCTYVSRILLPGEHHSRLLRNLVEIPFNIFNTASIRLATSLWARVANDRPGLQADLLAEISRCWRKTIKLRKGMFSLAVNNDNPFSRVMEYAPTDKEAIAKEAKNARALLTPHLIIIKFLSSRVQAPQSPGVPGQKILLQIVRSTMKAMTEGWVSDHMFARELRLRILMIATMLGKLLGKLSPVFCRRPSRALLYDAALSIFASSPRWAFGSDVGQMHQDRQLFSMFFDSLRADSTADQKALAYKAQLLRYLIETEIHRIDLWLEPMKLSKVKEVSTGQIQSLLTTAWQSDPAIAISLAQRFSDPAIRIAVRSLIIQRPWECLRLPYAAEYLLGSTLSASSSKAFRYLIYWAPVVPITAATYFLPSFKSHPLVLQYAMRSLESHPVEVTFFYVPQIVQVLRHDKLGYVRRFIIETAKLSQLFAHQIIWNFDANAYKDEDATIPDTIKPTLDSIKSTMLQNLSGADKLFYETEFRFFGEITSISGKLKPFIKKTKREKKAKIDQEMALIKVEQGVYLPSNPDGEVIDIDRKSGRPLQSHAKAPFMATFRIRKSRQVEAAFEDDLQVEDNRERQSRKQRVDVVEKNQSAIFKVGDDCRQDVLALQLISTFRSIFNSIGLDLYVFPYRVTATAPGCGVIDVLPNSISRDMLGREAVNGLYDYYITTFGKPETIAFQQARMNFVKSLAAYSVITYLLQFKDRHNGNIMYDSEGHVLHIDFGFCFDIAPGGINFESGPFKLTTEMIAVMGGSAHTQSYRIFQELSIKAFLVARQYSEQIIHLVTLMLDSGLPCFKGQTTIDNLRNRFHMDVSEHQASQVMLNLIAQSHQNQRTVAYDVFQKMVKESQKLC